MKKIIMTLLTLSAMTSAFALDFMIFEPKLNGLSEKDCESMVLAVKSLNAKVASVDIELQKTSQENQELFEEMVESPTQKLTSRIHNLCYKIDIFE